WGQVHRAVHPGRVLHRTRRARTGVYVPGTWDRRALGGHGLSQGRAGPGSFTIRPPLQGTTSPNGLLRVDIASLGPRDAHAHHGRGEFRLVPERNVEIQPRANRAGKKVGVDPELVSRARTEIPGIFGDERHARHSASDSR